MWEIVGSPCFGRDGLLSPSMEVGRVECCPRFLWFLGKWLDDDWERLGDGNNWDLLYGVDSHFHGVMFVECWLGSGENGFVEKVSRM